MLALSSVSTGCAAATRVALQEDQRAQLHGVQTVAGLSQQEIQSSIDPSRAGVIVIGGLIGGLVDAAVDSNRSKAAEQTIVPVRDALVDYDAPAALRSALGASFPEVAWLRDGQIEVRTLARSPTVARDVASSAEADAVLLVLADYRLSADVTRVVITAQVSLLPCRGSLAPKGIPPAGPVPLYRNTLWTVVSLPDLPAGTARDAAAARWARDGGKDARRALDAAMADLARMIAWDLEQAAPTSGNYASPAKAVEILGAYAGEARSAAPLADRGGRRWLRVSSGELASTGELVGEAAAQAAPPAPPAPPTAAEEPAGDDGAPGQLRVAGVVYLPSTAQYQPPRRNRMDAGGRKRMGETPSPFEPKQDVNAEADDRPVASDQIRHSAAGDLRLGREIRAVVRETLVSELGAGGVSVGTSGRVLSGTVEELLANDTGNNVDWVLRVAYDVRDEDGAVLFHGVKTTERRTGKPVQGALGGVLAANVRDLLQDPAFRKAVQ